MTENTKDKESKSQDNSNTVRAFLKEAWERTHPHLSYTIPAEVFIDICAAMMKGDVLIMTKEQFQNHLRDVTKTANEQIRDITQTARDAVREAHELIDILIAERVEVPPGKLH